MDEERVFCFAAVLFDDSGAKKKGEAKRNPFSADFHALKFQLVQRGFDLL